jgi:hypothetical protein
MHSGRASNFNVIHTQTHSTITHWNLIGFGIQISYLAGNLPLEDLD